MDAVVGYRYINELNGLNIEVSKKLDGEYDVEEIVSAFKNFFFNKLFLDITAIKNYKDLTNLQKLSMSLDMDKVILFLDKDDPTCKSKSFLAKLVSMGIYNFTDDVNNLMYLYNNPNNYRDVAYLQQIENTEEDEKKTTDSVSHASHGKKILGIKNVTDGAGSTTLSFLLKKVLGDYYNTMALELNQRDFTYFKDKDAISIKEEDFDRVISRYNDVDYFIVDLGKTKAERLCDDVLYLIEPSTIKLNKLSLINPGIFSSLKGKKVILNKSLLSDSDIASFEVESGLKVFYAIEPLNDKGNVSDKLLPLLEKLRYIKALDDDEDHHTSKKSIFDLFK